MTNSVDTEPKEPKCGVCIGKGDPGTGKPCICGGSGLEIDEVIGLRLALHDMYERFDGAMTRAKELAAQWDKRGRDASKAGGDPVLVQGLINGGNALTDLVTELEKEPSTGADSTVAVPLDKKQADLAYREISFDFDFKRAVKTVLTSQDGIVITLDGFNTIRSLEGANDFFKHNSPRFAVSKNLEGPSEDEQLFTTINEALREWVKMCLEYEGVEKTQ